MANVLINEDTMSAIGTAIREKLGEDTTYLPAEMPDKISSISGGSSAVIRRYAHSPNISDDGTINGTYDKNLDYVETFTVSGAEKLEIKIQYSTETKDWICIWSGSHSDYLPSINYSSSISGKLYGGYSQSSLPNNKSYTIEGDSVTIGMYSNSSTGYAGYYATILASVDGYPLGYDDGYKAGYEDGYNNGYNNGLNEDYDDGYQAGYKAGYEDGYKKGSELKILLSGNCDHIFRSDLIEVIDKFYTDAEYPITSAKSMFYDQESVYGLPSWTFYFNQANLDGIFTDCHSLEIFPTLSGSAINIRAAFGSCYCLTTSELKRIMKDLTINYQGLTSGYLSSLFYQCYNLEEVDEEIFDKFFNENYYSALNFDSNQFFQTFFNCVSLTQIKGLPLKQAKCSSTFNAFSGCGLLQHVILNSYNGEEIDLDGFTLYLNCNNMGYLGSNTLSYFYRWAKNYSQYNCVDATDTYELYKNGLYYTQNIAYSKYNHDSAVETINSLPKVSGSCTVAFTGRSGSATDGGAINTLTEEEIAIATDKGWTVSLTT